MGNQKKPIRLRLGSGAGYSGDRIEPAVALARKGNIQYLVFECLAERTIALAQNAKKENPELGYDPLLEERLKACLPVCMENGVKIITNMGAANPLGAMEKAASVAVSLGIKNLKIAAVTGDDVLHVIRENDFEVMETGEKLNSFGDRIISANAYLGAQPIAEALKNEADLVITGRAADPALFLAPLMYEFGWSFKDYHLLGKGTVLGHLLECAGQVTGGYFADPGYKDVPGLEELGFPIAEAQKDGSFFITKLPDAGGAVTAATCKEQLLYEIHDPAKYFTPDVVADFSEVVVREIDKDKVEVTGGSGREKTGQLKVSVGYVDSFMGEGQISYGGPGAVERGKLAIHIIKHRLEKSGIEILESDFSLIGLNSLYGEKLSQGNPNEIRVRVAARTASMSDAVKIGNEVEALYTNGPAGGGGVTKSAREVVAIKSVLIDENLIQPEIHYKTV